MTRQQDDARRQADAVQIDGTLTHRDLSRNEQRRTLATSCGRL